MSEREVVIVFLALSAAAVAGIAVIFIRMMAAAVDMDDAGRPGDALPGRRAPAQLTPRDLADLHEEARRITEQGS